MTYSILSHFYGGRASDRYVVNGSGFYGLLEEKYMIMAERGFQIHDKLF